MHRLAVVRNSSVISLIHHQAWSSWNSLLLLPLCHCCFSSLPLSSPAPDTCWPPVVRQSRQPVCCQLPAAAHCCHTGYAMSQAKQPTCTSHKATCAHQHCSRHVQPSSTQCTSATQHTGICSSFSLKKHLLPLAFFSLGFRDCGPKLLDKRHNERA
jgi:hypothetical protein